MSRPHAVRLLVCQWILNLRGGSLTASGSYLAKLIGPGLYSRANQFVNLAKANVEASRREASGLPVDPQLAERLPDGVRQLPGQTDWPWAVLHRDLILGPRSTRMRG